LKNGVYGVSGLCNPETSCNAPYFFEENTIPDYKIRNSRAFLEKLGRARKPTWEK